MNLIFSDSFVLFFQCHMMFLAVIKDMSVLRDHMVYVYQIGKFNTFSWRENHIASLYPDACREGVPSPALSGTWFGTANYNCQMPTATI